MPITARGNKELQTMANQKLKEGVTDPLERLRLKCLSRGADGIAGISREFRIMDVDGTLSLTLQEFITGCDRFGVALQKGEANEIFTAIDRDNSGSVSFDEFIESLRPPISQGRKELIMKAFNKLDKTGDGKITPEDLKGTYDVRHHPKYKSGEWSEERVLQEFLKTFEKPNDSDSVVTREEFFNYYTGISASIDNDAYFDLMMRRSYAL